MILESNNLPTAALGEQMHALAAELYPICRSLTGPGVRETLKRLAQIVPLELCEVPTGTKVFDWEVPREWTIRDAYIKDESGRRLVDFGRCNLHVVGYSIPVRTTLSWSQLKPRLHYLPEHADWIPYRNTYSREDWGFCLSYRQFKELDALGDRLYEVCIDSSLERGSLTYGEVYLPGKVDEEVLISTHICHPSLANDNLSGIVAATFLAQSLQQKARRYSFRIVYIPATIGAIAWLSLNRNRVSRIEHGWVLTGVGDAGPLTYKRSRRGNAEVDRAFDHVLRHAGNANSIMDFEPFGYDERQFCSPGFNLPMGCLMRTPNGRYPEYHTSADNLDLIRPKSLADTLSICLQVIDVLEHNGRYVNRQPYCEPRLGTRGLHKPVGEGEEADAIQKALLWVLNLSDGRHTLLDIAERSGLPFVTIYQASELLREHQLLAEETRPHTCSEGSTPQLQPNLN